MAEAEIDYKKSVLHQKLQIKGFHERINLMDQENKWFINRNDEINDVIANQKQSMEDIIIKLTVELTNTNEEKSLNQKNLDKANEEIIKIEEQNERQFQKMVQQQNEYKEESSIKTAELEERLQNINYFQQKKTEMELLRESLKQELQEIKQERVKELVAKEKEKEEGTDKLKKDMLHQIQETKTSLLALKPEQLSASTRLTVLQNHQLTTELEYQSKQTEKLLFKNSKLQEQVITLRRDIEIHKQVEQELAKRSHFCQKLIGQLKTKITQVQSQNTNYKSQDEQQQKTNQEQIKEEKGKNEIITFLEKNLDLQEKKMGKLQSDYDVLKQENKYLSSQKTMVQPEDIGRSVMIQGLGTQVATFIKEAIPHLPQDNSINNNNNNQQQDQQGYNNYVNEQKQQLGANISDLEGLTNQQVNQLDVQQKNQVLHFLMEYFRPVLLNKNKSSLPLLNSMPSTSMKLLDLNINLQLQEHLTSFPKMKYNNSQMKLQSQSRFKGVPLEISTMIVRSNKQNPSSFK